jgi:hypothetical protein
MTPFQFPAPENFVGLEKPILEPTPRDKPVDIPPLPEIGEAFFLAEEEEYFSFEI